MTLTFDTERAKAHIQRFNNETVVYKPSPKTKARYDLSDGPHKWAWRWNRLRLISHHRLK
ncbi:unnamed protein product [Clonostachys solani]|uniref:Uncharacterized protein n=1 Tax=Clonostachys solani TaxID=160281 RepID=A0A9P0EMC7_9HYPO|nr:unnamed protein product [Clonostachys solani]